MKKESKIPGNSDKPDPLSYWTHTINSLSSELNKAGEQSFRTKYPHPFLVLLSAPEGAHNDKWTDPQTDEDSQSKSLPIQNKNIRNTIIGITKTDRNPFNNWITVGRAKNNDIIIRSSKISKLHATFIKQPSGQFVLVDKDSANGTQINQKRIESEQEISIDNGSQIAFYRFQFQFVDLDSMIQLLSRPSIPSEPSEPK